MIYYYCFVIFNIDPYKMKTILATLNKSKNTVYPYKHPGHITEEIPFTWEVCE